jgi:hypothetical protein
MPNPKFSGPGGNFQTKWQRFAKVLGHSCHTLKPEITQMVASPTSTLNYSESPGCTMGTSLGTSTERSTGLRWSCVTLSKSLCLSFLTSLKKVVAVISVRRAVMEIQ